MNTTTTVTIDLTKGILELPNQIDLTKFNFIEFLQNTQAHLIHTSLEYTALGVTVIIASGGIFYLFNIIPLQKKIDKISEQQQKIEQQERIIKKQSIKVKQAESRVKALEVEVKESIKKINELRKDVDSQNIDFQAEGARVLGVISQDKKLYSRVFQWWFSAAYYYNKQGEVSLVKTALRASKNGLDGIKKSGGIQKDRFDEYWKKSGKRVRERIEYFKQKDCESIYEIEKLINELTGENNRSK